MCCEIFKRFRCGCTKLKEVIYCPHVHEANELRDIYGVPNDDVRIDKLYDRCEYVSARRHLAQFTTCSGCLAETAAAAAAMLLSAIQVSEEPRKGQGNEVRDMDTNAD